MKVMPVLMPKDIDKYFFNRKSDITKINSFLAMLEHDIANHLLITGYHGVGKTFLLKKVLNQQPDNFLTSYLDLSNIYSQQEKLTEEEVIKEILNDIYETLVDKNILDNVKGELITLINELNLDNSSYDGDNLLNIPLSVIKDNYDKISTFTMQLPQNIVDWMDELKGYVIVVDEFQLLNTIKNPENFFNLIRNSTENQVNVSYIFTGSVSKTSDVIELINGQNGAFGGRMIQLNLDPFSKEETRKYIEEKSNGLTFTDEGFNRFYSFTMGIPAYINSLCMLLPDSEVCDEIIINDILLTNIDQVAVMWLYLWGRLSQREKELVKLLVEEDKLSWKGLIDKTDYAKSTITKYIDSLSDNGIVEYNSEHEYVLSDKLLKTWLMIKYANDGKYPL